jgi:hypothetical protein
MIHLKTDQFASKLVAVWAPLLLFFSFFPFLSLPCETLIVVVVLFPSALFIASLKPSLLRYYQHLVQQTSTDYCAPGLQCALESATYKFAIST